VFDVTWVEITGQKITINALGYFLWCIWVGWIFSTVGAFGEIMAGLGHISIFGLGQWAKQLKGTKISWISARMQANT